MFIQVKASAGVGARVPVKFGPRCAQLRAEKLKGLKTAILSIETELFYDLITIQYPALWMLKSRFPRAEAIEWKGSAKPAPGRGKSKN